MKLEGSLDAFSLPDIFQLLSFTKKSGALHLRRSSAGRTQQGVVHVREGALTGASSDVARQALVRRLVGAGLVDDDALEAAAGRTSAEDGVTVVRALREAGALSEQQAREVGVEHVTDAVFDLLRWPEGDFSFAVDEASPDDLGVALSADEVVTEVRRRLEEWATLAQAIPSPDLVLALAPAPKTDLAVARDEWPLLALVDGRRTVRELVSLSGRGEFAVVRALVALVERGLIVVGAEDADGATALLRRQRLLAALEGAQSEGAEDTGGDQGADGSVAPAAEPADTPQTGAAAEPVAAASSRPATGGVVPPRPEPFVPRRRPDFPEEPVPGQRTVVTASAPVDGTAAVDPARVEGAPSSLIERDPSVNKSLLLRLIAGVRGL